MYWHAFLQGNPDLFVFVWEFCIFIWFWFGFGFGAWGLPMGGEIESCFIAQANLELTDILLP